MALQPGINVSAARIGVDAATGKTLTGWRHCEQSITKILTTHLLTRVMRLDFGSNVPNLIDRPGNAAVIAGFYTAVYSALNKWEPGFRLRLIQLSSAGADGKYTFDYAGAFYPRGHLGDYSVTESRTAQAVISLTA